MSVVTPLETLPHVLAEQRSAGRTIGLVCGVFDLLHPGHLALFETASLSSDFLVVAIFDDASTRVMKGPGRPFVSLDQRASVVSAVQYVDALTVVDGLEIESFVDQIKPDVSFIGARDSICLPGRVVTVPVCRDFSASSMANKIVEGVDFSPWKSVSGDAGREPQNGRASTSFPFGMQRPNKESISRVFTFHGPADDDLIYSIIRRYNTFYEHDVLLALRQMTPANGVAIDVGANIGNHTVFFAAYLADLVLALEPVPESYELLQRNIAANELSNVLALPFAAGKQAGEGTIYRPPGAETNSGSVQVRLRSTPATSGSQAVSVVTLDDLVAQHSDQIGDRRVTLIKIDVEGNEHAVVLGAAKTIAKHKPIIAVELTNDYTFNSVNYLLSTHGYSPIVRYGNAIPLYIYHAKLKT